MVHSPPKGDARKRTSKACDRCRIKKTKCDGSKPCERCQKDDSICMFTRENKAIDKNHPKGYVEMLERQQKVLIAALQKLHEKSNTGDDILLDSPAPSPDGSRRVNQILSRISVPTLNEGNLNESKKYSTDDGHRSTVVQRAAWPSGGAMLCDDVQTQQFAQDPGGIDSFGMVWPDEDVCSMLHWDMFDQEKSSGASTVAPCSNEFGASPLLPGHYLHDTHSSNSWQPMNFTTDFYVSPSLVFGRDRPLGLENTIDSELSYLSQGFPGQGNV